MTQRPKAYMTLCGLALFLSLIVCPARVVVESALAGDDGSTAAEESSGREDAIVAADCRELAAALNQQKDLISRETGRLKREIAALRDDLSRPGIKEIFAGIGYIFGLAGVWLFAQNRRTTRS